MALADSGDMAGSVVELRDAIRREGLDQIGPFRLLDGILRAQRPERAVTALRRIRERVRDDPAVRDGIDLVVNQFERLSRLHTPIPTIFRLSIGGYNLAQLCYERQFFAASAAIWFAGFATDPKLADDMNAQNRYNAACSAALTAAGQGIDKPPLDETAKTRWRQQAIDWLRADLSCWTKHANGGASEAKSLATKTLEHWKADRDLAGVRDEKELAKLPEGERKEWQAFWSEVATLLAKAEKS